MESFIYFSSNRLKDYLTKNPEITHFLYDNLDVIEDLSKLFRRNKNEIDALSSLSLEASSEQSAPNKQGSSGENVLQKMDALFSQIEESRRKERAGENQPPVSEFEHENFFPEKITPTQAPEVKSPTSVLERSSPLSPVSFFQNSEKEFTTIGRSLDDLSLIEGEESLHPVALLRRASV